MTAREVALTVAGVLVAAFAAFLVVYVLAAGVLQ